MVKLEVVSHLILLFLYSGIRTLFFAAEECKASEKFAGGYKFEFKTLELCPDAHKYRVKFNLRLSRYNRSTITCSSIVTLPYDFDDSFTARLNIAVWGNGGYRDNFYNMQLDNLCSSMAFYVPQAFNRMAENIKVAPTCPIRAGKYFLNDFTIKSEVVSGFTEFPYGNYRVEIIFIKNHENGTKEDVACYRFILEVKQKKE